MKHRHMLHRLVKQSLPLEFFKTRLGEALCNLICPQSWPCFEQQFGLQTSDLSSSLNYPTILWLNDIALCIAVPYPQDLLWVTWKNDNTLCLKLLGVGYCALPHYCLWSSCVFQTAYIHRDKYRSHLEDLDCQRLLILTSRINFNTSIGSTFPTHSFHLMCSPQYGHREFFGKSWQHSV